MNGVLADTSVWIQPFNNQGGKEMRMTMKKLTQGATRLAAALSLFALVRCDGYLV